MGATDDEGSTPSAPTRPRRRPDATECEAHTLRRQHVLARRAPLDTRRAHDTQEHYLP